jgi:alkylation response protein AidB-like acyl-CoA dehydrogenase
LEAEIRTATAPYRDTMIPKPVVHDLLVKMIPYGVGAGWLPEEDGGMGLDLITSGLLYEELSRVCPGLAGTAYINEATAISIAWVGSPDLKAKYVPGLLAGKLIGCEAITEPSVGSNPRDVKTRAVKDGDYYRITGEKTWISNGHVSDIAIVVCRTEDHGPGVLSLFLVDRNEHGYESRDLPKLGLNAWSTGQLYFDDVKVPAAHMIGLPGVGLKQTIRMFERVRCFVAIQAIGIAQAALDEALRYAKERVQWGKPIGGHQLVQAMIAEMATELDAARMLTLRGLHLLQKGVRCDTQTSMAKFYATETAIRVASKAVQIHGAYGISKEYPVEQMFRDARMMTIPDGTTEIQKLIIARNLLGIAAFGDMRRE